MKVIIPMSGMGNRFVQAGYSTPKPLIEMNGKPMIDHVVGMFPGVQDYVFICNSQHLAETNMREILEKVSPYGQIIEILPHKKGPVYAVHLVEDLIDDEEEVIVNYCDFSCYWDFNDFLNHTRQRDSDGAVPAYRGFHPHMLGTTNYAFMREEDQWMLEIKEKEPFTDNRMQEYASSGTYYFRKGRQLKKYFKQLMDLDINLKGEYYVSLVYNLLVRDGLKVSIYEIEHMLQWGTPSDVEEYNYFSKYFEALSDPINKVKLDEVGTTLIPLAGAGKRFAVEGYTDPKPLIPVSGKPMIIQAASSLPNTPRNIFVCLEEHLRNYSLEESIREEYPYSKIIGLNTVTEGQACTCELGLVDEDENLPLLIAPCDNGMLWNQERYQELLHDYSTDVIVWTFRNHPSSERNPQMYGWVKTVDGVNATGVSVKKAISKDTKNDHAIVGTFYFRKMAYFKESLRRLYDKDNRVNGEFYVDSCIGELIELGYKVKVFEISHYICWGTPNDYRTFKYWQSFFHKVDWHPYSLENDFNLDPNKMETLRQEYLSFSEVYNTI